MVKSTSIRRNSVSIFYDCTAPTRPTRAFVIADTTNRSKTHVGRLEITIVAVVAVVLCVGVGLKEGQDANWDLLNYHYYSGYALLHGRFAIDVAASQIQTWLNPLPSVLVYLLISSASPQIASGILAALSAVSVVLVFVIARLALSSEQSTKSAWAMAAIAAIGAFMSPMFLSELGATLADGIIAAFILAALATLFFGRFGTLAYFISGLLIGVALALKLTNGCFLIAWFFATLFVERWRSMRAMFATGLGACLSYLPLGGVWNFYIFRMYDNPVFPFFNHLFKSPFYGLQPISDDRFKPHGFADALSYFWKWPLGLHPTTEVPFADLRFTLILFLLPVVAMLLWDRRASGESIRPQTFDRRPRAFLLVFCLVGFVVWLRAFSIQRYAVVLEMLAPLLLIMLLSFVVRNRRVLLACSAMAVLAISLTTSRANWRRVPFTHDWFDVSVADELKGGNTFFVMLSGDPMAYVIPYLPASDVFVRIEGNMPITTTTGIGRAIAAKLMQHKGDIRTLTPLNYDTKGSVLHLQKFGLRIESDDCLKIPTKMGVLITCRLVEDKVSSLISNRSGA